MKFILIFLILIISISNVLCMVKPDPKDPDTIVLAFVSYVGDPEYKQYSGGAEIARQEFITKFQTVHKKNISIYFVPDSNDITDAIDNVNIPVNGVIGPAYTGASTVQCLVYGAFEVPSISFYATGTALSNPDSYPYFQRTMPDDRLQVKAILSFVQKNGWSRISCVHTNEDYGNGGADQLVQQSNAIGITVNTNQAIPAIDTKIPLPAQEQYDILFDNLVAAKSRVIVLYALFPIDCKVMWHHAKRRGFLGSGFTWIVTDGCAELTQQDPTEIEHLDQTGTTDKIVSFDYTDYVGTLATFPNYGLGGAAYEQFKSNIIADYGDGNSTTFYKGASFSYDSTKALLLALDTVLTEGKNIWDGTVVREALRNTSFAGITGNVAFDPETGDRLHGVFSLLNFVDPVEGSFESIGSIDPQTGDITLTKQVLYMGPQRDVPSDYQVVLLDRTLNIVLGVITGVCVLLIIGIGTVIVLQWRKFRYSSPLFCIFIIVGALMGLASVFTLLSEPTIALCSSFPWLLGLGYVILFGTLFAKTWRTWRLFHNARKFKVIRITNKYIITLVGGFVLLETVFMILWTTIDRQIPSAEPIYKAGEAQLQCTSDSQAWWFVFVFYKVFYILVGVFLAFKTRDVVDSLNESKPITLALYNLTFVMIVAIALGFILRDNPVAIIVIETIAILLGFTVTVSVLFLPKVWLILSGQQHSIDSIGTSMDSMGRSNNKETIGEGHSRSGYTTQDYNNQSVGRSFSASTTGFNNVQPSNHPQLGIVYTGGDNFPRLPSNTVASRSESEIVVSQDVLNKNKAAASTSAAPSESKEPTDNNA